MLEHHLEISPVKKPGRARRAVFYMPGDDLHKIQKATTLGADCICMDLEDAVALNRKQAARSTAAVALQTLDFGSSERLVRINPADSDLALADLEAVLPAQPDGIVLTKAESAAAINWVAERLAAAEARYGWPAGSIILIAIIERARAFLNLAEMCAAGGPRLEALIFGSEDLAVELGAVRTPAATELLYARSSVVLHAAAFGLQAIDAITLDFHDLDTLRRETRQGLELGYAGKQVIHPNQVGPVQEIYTPTAAEIAHAQALVAAFAAHQAQGSGEFAIDGKLVDLPVIKAAENVLRRASGVK